MVTRYENLSGVNANYIDGSFASLSQVAGTQSALLLGTAEQGLSNVPFLVRDIGGAASEFGRDSELVTLAGQLTQIEDTNVFVTRIGGKQSHFIIEKDISESAERETLIRISPRERGAADRFADVKALFLPVTDGDNIRQRVLLLDNNTEVVLFDSEEILSVDDSGFEVIINNDIGEVLISKASSFTAPTTTDAIKELGESDPRGTHTLSELTSLETLVGGATLDNHITRVYDVYNAASTIGFGAATVFGTGHMAATNESIEGSSDANLTHCERFAAVESAYADLEDTGVDFMYCEGCYADVSMIPADGLRATEMQRWDQEYLGSAHKSVIGGRPNITMFASPDPLSASHVVASTVTVGKTVTQGTFTGDVEVIAHSESIGLGLLLTLNDIRIEHGASSEVEEYFESDGKLKVNVKAALTATTAGMVHANGSFSAGTLTIGAFQIDTSTLKINIPEKVIDVSGMSYPDEAALIRDHTEDVKLSLDLRNLFKLNGGNPGDHSVKRAVLTHFDLTGELVEEEAVDELMVLSNGKYVLADDAYAREVNFAHQAGSMAYLASTEYKSTLAFVPTTRAKGGLRQLNRWAGKAPEYKIDSNGDLIVEKNGTSFMSNKFLFGSTSFRTNAKGNGVAYGGLIQTEKGFGIDSDDELLDSRGYPVDLGKHVVVVGAYGVVPVPGVSRNPSFAVSNLGPKLIERLAALPVNEEPIGPVNGLIPGVSTTGAINSRALLNDIALGRVTMIDSNGAIANMKTAALPTSDYTRVSTIRAANLVLDAVRSTSLSYLGRAFSDAQMAALETELGGIMRSLKNANAIQEGTVQMSASRLDRINGRLNLKVQFIPPLSIEAITVDLTVSAPQ
jgi:hypothetical protein